MSYKKIQSKNHIQNQIIISYLFLERTYTWNCFTTISCVVHTISSIYCKGTVVIFFVKIRRVGHIAVVRVNGYS